MSEHQPQRSHVVHEVHSVAVVTETNGAGFWGFILSLLGVTCCVGTCFSWVGLIVSLVGLTKRPRGFAVAGVILGFIGTFGGLAFWGTAGKPVIRLARSIGLVEIRTVASMWEAEKFVLREYDETGSLPASMTDIADGALVFSDQWGTPLGYKVNNAGDGYSFHSAGPDVLWGTGDELSYTVLDANEPGEFIASRGMVSLIDASTLPYTAEQIENAPAPDEQGDEQADGQSDAQDGGPDGDPATDDGG